MGRRLSTARSAASSCRACGPDGLVEGDREPRHRDHRGDPDGEAGGEEDDPTGRSAELAHSAGPVHLTAQLVSSCSMRPSRRWIRRSASAATAGSWVTSTSVAPSLRPHFGEQVEDHAAGRTVEVAGGLVGEEQRRFGGEGAGQRHPLLLAARELRRVVVAAFAEPDRCAAARRRASRASERPSSSIGSITFSRAVKLPSSWKDWKTKPIVWRRISASRSSDSRSMRSPLIEHSAGARSVEPGHEGEQGRLAAARRPEHGDELARGDVEIDRRRGWSASCRPMAIAVRPRGARAVPDCRSRGHWSLTLITLQSHPCCRSFQHGGDFGAWRRPWRFSLQRYSAAGRLRHRSPKHPRQPSRRPPRSNRAIRIVVLGDSLAAGLGLAESRGLPGGLGIPSSR